MGEPREKPSQTPFRPPQNPHGGTETRTQGPSGGRRASNRLRHEAAYEHIKQTDILYILWLMWLVDRLPPHWCPEFPSQSLHGGFMVDKMGYGWVLFGISPIFPYHKFHSTISPHSSHSLHFISFH